MKTGITYDFDSANIKDKAEMIDTPFLSSRMSPRLRKDLIYVVPKQFVHDEKLTNPINGHNISKRIFVVGYSIEYDEPVQVVTLSINGLIQGHFGPVEDNEDLLIEATNENETKVWRAVAGTPMASMFSIGKVPIKQFGKYAYVCEFAFKVVDRRNCFIVQFAEPRKVNGKEVYDMLTFEKDGKHYLQLGFTRLNNYQIVDKVPIVNWKEVCREVAVFQEGLPE